MLRRQLNNAVLALLAITAAVSFFLGDSTQAIIIGIILAVSIGLGFVTEYRAERANDLVVGDVNRLTLGELIPADVALIDISTDDPFDLVQWQDKSDVHQGCGDAARVRNSVQRQPPE